MKQETMQELQAQLVQIDINLSVLKVQKEQASKLVRRFNKGRIHKTVEPALCVFHVITGKGLVIPLTAHTLNPKKYATALFEETDCTVRIGEMRSFHKEVK